MTTITSAQAPRQIPAWLKFGSIILTTFVVCWAIVLWYWRITNVDPGTGDLALALVILPAGLLLGFWGANKAIAAREASRTAATSATPSSAPATTAAHAATSAPMLAILATALRSPYGASVEELASAIADNEARADLDKELVDDNGFPVMTARSDDALDEALQDEIAEWLTSQGIRQLHLSEEQWRALTLATGVAGELASTAAADLMPVEGKPPVLQLRLLLPQDWPIDVRRAATMWLTHTVGQYGWPEAAISTPAVLEVAPHITPTAVLQELAPGASSDNKPLVAIVIACGSLIGQESVDRLAASGSLFVSSQSRGQIPGEGAAGLLVTDLPQAQAFADAGAALLGPFYERRRDSSADDMRKVDSSLLLQLVEQVRTAATVDVSEIAMIVADTAHRPKRVLELMELSAPAIPQLDAADDIIRIGLGSGSCGDVPFMTSLAMARYYAHERSAPVLCISNEDPYLRSAALVRPLA